MKKPTTPPPSTLEKRIAAEREAMNLAPWQFSPTEVQDEPCPYPKGTAGHDAWAVAAAQWREMQAARKPAAPPADPGPTAP